MLDSADISALGNLLNTTWGHSWTDGTGSFPLGTQTPGSFKGHLVTTSDGTIQLVMTLTDLVTFRSDQEAVAEKKRQRTFAERRCNAFITLLKKKFRENRGRALKMKAVRDLDSIETIYSPTPEVSLIALPTRRPSIFRGYYRYTTIFAVS